MTERPLAWVIAGTLLVAPSQEARAQVSQGTTPAAPVTSPGRSQPTPTDQQKPEVESPASGRQRRRPSTRTSRATSSRRPSRSEPVRTELTLTANALGGYDDNVGSSLGAGGGTVSPAAASGTTGFADVMLDYFRGNQARGINVKALTSLTLFPGYLDSAEPAYKVRFVGTSEFARRFKIRFSTQARFEPMFSPGLGEGGDPGSAGDFTDVSATALSTTGAGVATPSLLLRKSWVNSTKTDFDTRWNERNTTRVFYNFFIQEFTTDLNGQTYQYGRLEHAYVAGKHVTISGGLDHMAGQFTDAAGITRPRTEDTVRVSISTEASLMGKPLSLIAGAGVGRLSSQTSQLVPYEDQMPVGQAGASLGLTRDWSMSGGYQRGYVALQGLTGELYASDTWRLAVDGKLASRVRVGASARSGSGQTVSPTGSVDTYRVSGASLGFGIDVGSMTAVTVTAYYFSQRYSNPESLPADFPAQYDRAAMTVGLSFWLPLAGQGAKPRSPDSW